MDYRAPFWLPGGHLQTIYPAKCIAKPAVHYRRERWDTPDGDFIDIDFVDGTHSQSVRGTDPGTPVRGTDPGPSVQGTDPSQPVPGAAAGQRGPYAQDRLSGTAAPLVVLFHGLEGSSDSHYARALMAAVAARGWHGAVPHFRGCSGMANRAPRFYHSGDAAEVDWIMRRLAASRPAGSRLYAVGVSLGGNALLRWLGESQHGADVVDAACAVSAPLDLAQGGAALSRGFNRVYTRMFLQTLKPKCLAKLAQFPGLFDRDALLAARDLYAFDNVVTAPLHGYRDTDDYWHRASARHILGDITVPTLVLNARNDPFLPGQYLPQRASRSVVLDYPAHGGHVGFASGALPGQLDWLPRRLLQFLDGHHAPVRPPHGSTEHG